MGPRIAQARRAHGLTQRQLGELVDHSQSWVSNLERGVIRIDRITVLEHLAEVLGMTMAELTGAPMVGGQ